MSQNYFANPLNTQLPPRRQPGGMAAYLLGMAPIPPPTQQEMAVAVANRLLDEQAGGREESVECSGDENQVDPQLGRHSQILPALVNDVQAITVRVPVNDKVVRDINFSPDIPRRDFFDRIFAAMNLDPNTAQLGWKTNDEPKRTAAHRLKDESDVNDAFKMLVNMMNNPRRRKEVVMIIIHLNPVPVEVAKKKGDGNRVTDFTYANDLRMVQEKLRCAQHGGPNRWCYISPENPTEHIALGLEEVTLWARKIHDNDADNDCVTPPNCLRLDNLRQRVSRVRRNPSKSDTTPIHVHINNNPLAGSSTSNASALSYVHHSATSMPHPTLKRSHSITSSSGSEIETESLTLSDILQELHQKFPKLNLPQYEGILQEQGILYAESVQDFGRDYYIQLGMAVGAVGTFMSGVRKAVEKAKKAKRALKRAKVSDKENLTYNRAESIEV